MQFVFIVFLLIMGLVDSVCATVIQVTPIRQHVKPNQKTTSFEVINNGEEPVSFQLSAHRWRNTLGKDQLEETNDILVTPPIFSVAPKEKQIIRIGFNVPPDPKRGATYRVNLKEVPNPHTKDSTKGKTSLSLETVLEVSIPIVVSPRVPSEPKVKWTVKKIGNKKIMVAVQNLGECFISLHRVALRKENEKRAFICQPVELYILPNVKKEFELNLPCSLTNKQVELEASTDHGELKETVPVQII